MGKVGFKQCWPISRFEDIPFKKRAIFKTLNNKCKTKDVFEGKSI
jgi:hypothetical protein